MLKWGSMKLGHIFLQMNSIFLALTCLKKVRWAGNSSPISVPEIISSWDHLRPRHWWIRRDSCGEFQCRARSGIHVGNLSLCFGSGCFLIYIHIYIYSLFPQIADWSMIYTCMCAVVEDLTGLIDQFPFLVAFQTRGNLWVTGGFVGWILLVGWMCDWTVFTKASCSWHGFSECSFTHSNHESFAAGRCRTPMATSITSRSWWKDWFEKLASNFQWEVLGPPIVGCNLLPPHWQEHGDSDTVVDVARVSQRCPSFHFLDFFGQKYEIKTSLIIYRNINLHDTKMETLQDIKHFSINVNTTHVFWARRFWSSQSEWNTCPEVKALKEGFIPEQKS